MTRQNLNNNQLIMNTLDLIENDYKLLHSEMKKKYTNIKDPVERALKVIQNCKGQQDQALQITAQMDVMLSPLTMIFESKAIKLYIPTLNCLQKLSQTFNLSDNAIVIILTMLKDGSGTAIEGGVDEMTQIKILQILLIFLNPKTLRISKEFVDLILHCIFSLFQSKSNAVKSTIQATLRQLFSIIFSAFTQKCKEHASANSANNEDQFIDGSTQARKKAFLSQKEKQEMAAKMKGTESESIFRITLELIVPLANFLGQADALQTGKQVIQKSYIWNMQPCAATRAIILDVLCLALSQTQDLFSYFPNSILRVFDQEVVPTLEQIFKSSSKQNPIDYTIGVRLMKLTILIINNLGIGINLLTYILQETDNIFLRTKDGTQLLNLTWKNLIAFEGVALILNNPHLIQIFSQSALTVGKTVLVQIFESLMAATQGDLLDLTGEGSQKHMSSPFYSQQKTPKFVEAQQVLDVEIPPPSSAQIHKLIIECICCFVENVIIIFDYNGFKIGANKQSQQRNQDTISMNRPVSQISEGGLTSKMSNVNSSIKNDGYSQCKDLLHISWKCLLIVLQNLMKTTNDESNIQLLLNSYQNFIGVCGSIAFKGGNSAFEARDAYLESLCNLCLTPAQPRQQVNTVLSSQVEMMLNDKNIQICKTLLNIAHCLGYILDVRSWFIILECMQRIETVIRTQSKSLLRKGGVLSRSGPSTAPLTQSNPPAINQATGAQQLVEFNEIRQRVQEKMNEYNMGGSQQEEVKSNTHQRSMSMRDQSAQKEVSQGKNLGPAPLEVTGPYQPSIMESTDLQILQDSFDSLFTSSLLFDQQSLTELITALGQLTVGVLESSGISKKLSIGGQTDLKNINYQSRTTIQPNESEVLANINTFAISRLVETSLVNISRVEIIWKVLIAHFEILSNCKVQALRQLSMEALLCVILEIFNHRKEKKGEQEKKRANSVEMQNDVPAEEDHISEENASPDVDENWSGMIWQYTILISFADQLKSPHANNKIQTLKGIERIIQTCGQQLKNDGWRLVILTISKAPELIENDQIVATGFKCLKLIVNHYIDKLSQDNFITILHAIYKYACNDGENINNNLTAVGMFQNIADYTAKLSQKDSSFNTLRIWTILFERIQELGGDFRNELRKANIFTLENILMTHGPLLSGEVWSALLRGSLLQMLRFSMDMFIQQRGGIVSKFQYEAGLPTPSFSQASAQKKNGQPPPKKKMNFDDEAVMKALQKNNDEQWEETCTLLLQTMLRTIKKYIQLEQKQNDVVNFAWSSTVSSVSDLIKNGTQDICMTVYKAIEDLLSQANCVDLFMNNIGTSFKILDATSEWLALERQDIHNQNATPHRKPSTLKLCPVIIQTLKKIFSLENVQENQSQMQFRAPYLQIIIPTYAQILFQLLHRLMRCAVKSASEGFQGMGVPHKLMTEEKLMFEFIENLNQIVKKNSQTHLMYFQFLMLFTEYEVSEPHTEAFIRRTFSLLNSIILQGDVSNDLLIEILPGLFDRIEHLINLRYNNEACMGLVFPSKGSQTLFFTVGLYAMHYSSFLINPRHFKARMTANYKSNQEQQQHTRNSSLAQSTVQTGGSTGGFVGLGGVKLNKSEDSFIGQNSSTDIMFSEQLEFAIVDPALISTQPMQEPEIKKLVWTRILSLVRKTLLFNPELIIQHNKAVVEDVVKSSQDLDMQAMNFITNSLLPNCSDANDKEFQSTLVAIIDNGCNSVYSTQRLSGQGSGQQSSAFGNSLSKYCLNNLFELCRYQPLYLPIEDGSSSPQSPNDKKIHDIKRKIATITTPVLINRCRDTLKKYAMDEMKSGNMSLPRQRVSEAAFILEKLRQLDCYPEIQSQYKSKKGHLVSLMPIFAELVMSNEAGLKEHLRLIFLDISEAVQTGTTSASDQEHKVGGSSGGEF